MDRAVNPWTQLRTNIQTNWLEERGNARNRMYRAVLAGEDGGAPVGMFRQRDPDALIGPEVDEWIITPMCHEIDTLMLPGEDFAFADELHQRLFLILAAEVLYGPHHDARLLAEAVMKANEPV
jgi:hypothetical protein